MNLALPLYRNSFHPAWLLLILPPFVGFCIPELSEDLGVRVVLIFRILLALTLVAPVVFLLTRPVSGRSRRLLKELRQQMPGSFIAILGVGVFGWNPQSEMTALSVSSFGFGCLLMGATAFGLEFDQRTIGSLLTQPISRSTIYSEKLVVVGFLSRLGWVNVVLAKVPHQGIRFQFQDALSVGLLPLVGMCSGPWLAMISRGTLPGMVFSMGLPLGLMIILSGLVENVVRPQVPEWGLNQRVAQSCLWVGTPVYLLATCVLGWRRFQTLEVNGGAAGRASTGLPPITLPLERALLWVLPRRNVAVSLIRKELRLHVVPWLLASIMVGLWVLWCIARWRATVGAGEELFNDPKILVLLGQLLGIFTLLSAGAACVAEERELGTLDWQLTQPVTIRLQWWIKVGVAATLGFWLGLVLPLGLIWVGVGSDRLFSEFSEIPVWAFGLYLAATCLLFWISVFTSSISRKTIQATAGAIALAVAIWGIVLGMTIWGWSAMKTMSLDANGMWDSVAAAGPQMTSEAAFFWSGTFGGVVLLLHLALLSGLARRNFQRAYIPLRLMKRQVLGVLLMTILLVGMFGCVVLQIGQRVLREERASEQGGDGLRLVVRTPSKDNRGSINGVGSTPGVGGLQQAQIQIDLESKKR
jgi:ABC-type transport system involved in multi-copper enzyme maturation permease subunit